MKFITLIITTIFLFGISTAYSQEIPEGAVMISDKTIVKDASGKQIDMFQAMELTKTGEWKLEAVNDENGKMQYLQLKRTTAEEKRMIANMPAEMNSDDLVGKKAPDFKMLDINGKTISSENTKGKVVVLNFWFIACKPCVAEIPDLNKVYEQYKNDTNVVFASITFDKREKVQSFLKNTPIKYPVVTDAKEICNLFKVVGYPTNIVIGKNGNYFGSISGGNAQIGQQISSSIQNALENKKPSVSSVPSGGVRLGPNTIFKFENGDTIPIDEAMKLMNSNEYDMIPKKDETNKEFYLLKKKN